MFTTLLKGLGWMVVLQAPPGGRAQGRRVLFQLGEEQSPGMRLIDSDQMGGHT